MTELIACLSTGKGTWAHVSSLIEKADWRRVFLVTNEFGLRFDLKGKGGFVVTDFDKGIDSITSDIVKQLDGKLKGLEVALNLASGTGKEHMAIISALMKLGVGFRLVVLTKEGIKEI